MPRKPERSPIPRWAERERNGDLLWIAENMHVFWPLAQAALASAGIGALFIELTIRYGTGHPILYVPKEDVELLDDPDMLRMLNEYDPFREMVIVLLKAQQRTSTYRVQGPQA